MMAEPRHFMPTPKHKGLKRDMSIHFQWETFGKFLKTHIPGDSMLNFEVASFIGSVDPCGPESFSIRLQSLVCM